MVKVIIHTNRDQPLDRDRVMQQLLPIPQEQDVVIDMDAEGPSIEHIGLRQILDDWLSDTGRSKSSIKIHTPNQVEKLDYEFYERLSLSHFFTKKQLLNYHRDFSQIDSVSRLFGIFLGNYTKDRNTIAETVLDQYLDHSVISVMRHHRYNASEWWSPKVYEIGSIDDAWVQHQYDSVHKPIQSLLSHYHKFQIEVVAETFTRGKTFFPTEKTVRPIMGSKPMLIFGPRDFLKNLQQIGFQTFDKLWSEAYDNYEGHERWMQMQAVMDVIVSDGYDLHTANHIVRHNHNRLQEIIIKYPE